MHITLLFPWRGVGGEVFLSTNNGETNNTRGGHGMFGLFGQRGKEA